jgi:hypothetical protein
MYSLGVELSYVNGLTDERTDKHDEANSRLLQFREDV